eukprot:CAMPEP_0114252770 /NCGR_PEP_ID=MMETSP0058-20121206/16022_1 /TAXON_ID=36894 /ORGANISM="Pyramimonas parkeae, CCMP726" /LENGTH=197 /DNA_ID=CAMNT_0001366743 /DNA_START=136 /DNA_END=729 /DNA_ORIENTATION=+
MKPTETTSKSKEKPQATELKLRSSALAVAPLMYPTVSDLAVRGPKGILQPIADSLTPLGLPEALVHWGHPGNMAVVLLAMGGYGTYLGWQIRTGDDADSIAKAEDLHPKLMAGMTFFFTLGALGGMISMVMQGKPAFQSSHFITGSVGLVLLYLQGMLSLFFEDDPNARTAHAFLGTGVMAVFFAHMLVGLKFGLSF